MKSIIFSFDYGTSPIWYKNSETEIYENGFPENLQRNTQITKLFYEIQREYESLFINNTVEFSFRGFLNEEQEKLFLEKIYRAIELLENEVEGKYILEVDYRI